VRTTLRNAQKPSNHSPILLNAIKEREEKRIQRREILLNSLYQEQIFLKKVKDANAENVFFMKK
jgi:hypothetical protein